MSKLKERLLAYRKTLNFLGIERKLELPSRTFKMWFGQNTEPKKVEQEKIKEYLKNLGRNLND